MHCAGAEVVSGSMVKKFKMISKVDADFVIGVALQIGQKSA